MASQLCLPQINVCALRVCSLNTNGTTLIGSATSYATDAAVSIGLTPVYVDGQTTSELNGCGSNFINYTADPTLTRWDLELDVWSTDPNFLDIVLPGGAVLTGGSGEKGFAYPGIGTVTGQISLEFWQKRINDNVLDATFPYAHHAMPFLKNIKLGKRDVSNNGVSHTIITAEGYENDNWFNGPGDDWAVASDKPYQWIPKATLPTMNCTAATIAS